MARTKILNISRVTSVVPSVDVTFTPGAQLSLGPWKEAVGGGAVAPLLRVRATQNQLRARLPRT